MARDVPAWGDYKPDIPAAKKVLDHVERISKIDGCPVICIGRAGREKNGRHTLAKRYRNFFGGHTAMFPVWALLYYGRLPALVKR